MSEDVSLTDTAEFDEKLACMTFECLERCSAWAAAHDEMDVAAEYADAFFTLTAQMPDFYGTFIRESELGAHLEDEQDYEAFVNHQMMRVRAWAEEHDHPVNEWFERAEQAMQEEGR